MYTLYKDTANCLKGIAISKSCSSMMFEFLNLAEDFGLQEASKLPRPNHYTGTCAPAIAIPLNANTRREIVTSLSC